MKVMVQALKRIPQIPMVVIYSRELNPADYIVKIEVPLDNIVSPKDQGLDDSVDSDFNSNGSSDIITLTSGKLEAKDLGYYFDCVIEAGGVEFKSMSADCHNKAPIIVMGSALGTPVIPASYALFYFLVNNAQGTIEAISTSPMFQIDIKGEFYMIPVIFNIDPTDPEYFDLSIINFGSTTIDDIQEYIKDEVLCAKVGKNSALFTIEACGLIDGGVWRDDNQDGLRVMEIGLQGIIVNLCDNNNSVLRSQFTDQNGNYKFDDLSPAQYRIKVISPTGFVFSPMDIGFR